MEPIYIADNTLYTEAGKFDVNITMLFARGIDMMLGVQFPYGYSKYLITEQMSQLQDDIQKICAKQKALNEDGPAECQAVDACPLEE